MSRLYRLSHDPLFQELTRVAKWSKDQPRAPAGSAQGGQWVKGKGGGALGASTEAAANAGNRDAIRRRAAFRAHEKRRANLAAGKAKAQAEAENKPTARRDLKPNVEFHKRIVGEMEAGLAGARDRYKRVNDAMNKLRAERGEIENEKQKWKDRLAKAQAMQQVAEQANIPTPPTPPALNDANFKEVEKELSTSFGKVRQAIEAQGMGAIPWAKRKQENVGGINDSGFVEIGGKKYWGKVSMRQEAEIEQAAWHVAKVLGWPDLARPTIAYIPRASLAKEEQGGFILNPLLPKGWTIGEQSYNAEAKKVSIRLDPDKQQRMMLFEHAIGAGDRHYNNYWITESGDVMGIDYARSFKANGDRRAGFWDKGWNKNRVVDRRHVEHVVNNRDAIIAQIPAQGGFNVSHKRAVEAANQRIDMLKEALDNNPGVAQINMANYLDIIKP